MSKRKIVKVQLPVIPKDAPALAYTEDRRNVTEIPVTDELREKMGDDVKRYFWATFDRNGVMFLGEVAPWQDW